MINPRPPPFLRISLISHGVTLSIHCQIPMIPTSPYIPSPTSLPKTDRTSGLPVDSYRCSFETAFLGYLKMLYLFLESFPPTTSLQNPCKIRLKKLQHKYT